MRIRTVTAMMQLRLSALDEQFEGASDFLHSAKESFAEKGIEVQTLRLSTQPFQAYMIGVGEDALLEQIAQIDRCAARTDVELVSIGFASAPSYIRLVPSILRSTERISVSAAISGKLEGVMEDNITAAADTIMEISRLTGDGIRNFNFACLGNCPPGIPFFPASHHFGGRMMFSIGLESGEIAVSSLLGKDPNHAEERIAASYWKECLHVQDICLGLEGDFSYLGMDTSWNPSLSEEGSVARAVSMLSRSPFGSHGTLAACSAMTRIVKDVHVKSCGYCGLMLPVLEDLELGRAADEGRITLQSLLAYSSVCGTGLDAIPVPGDVGGEDLARVLRDVANLSYRLDKPLSARLLPVPGATTGGRSSFDSPYVRNCTVLPVK
jgi:uncharacterized protein (UPF0210 family)